QIKWSLEHGIQYYLVDWYWNKGHQHNDHWVKGFYKAKYRSMFKWAMMWANHNGVGSHSEEDQRAVTKFWIENYFKTPEYLLRDGKPVVMIWSPAGMDNDVIAIEAKKGKTLKKGEGVKKLLDLSRQMAKDAGLKGIHFIAMKWPEASTKAEDIQWLADAGFDETSIYHFMHHGGKAANPARFSFDLVVEASVPYWEARLNTGILPFLPNLSTGWDARPWHAEKTTVISERTVAKFRQICSDFKKFADKNGIKEMVTAPTNEWGEGSYIEPNAEYGFGMFEAIRDIFCKKPASGWLPNFGPQDVGLGPYDFPPIDESPRTEWNFKDGKTYWTAFMGIRNYRNENGILAFETTNHDPAITTALQGVKADDWSKFVVRMKISPAAYSQDTCQLFWSTATSGVSEQNSLSMPVKIDGQFHDYTFDLKGVKNWRRSITSLRFDPLNSADKKVEIEFIRLEK
ncbi:MAG: glycoside hydrolase family 99-like domain-containing protein, partial [Planctomycetaceae bacterium]|nr:glycoside hydrolase family 99-like domain-containing protein [Planctomycetaceae bacterium]